ncbi:CmpA/NrtA family ABC transporter substrate-binding protein [Crenobacter intestini]|uniref:ABC transporter substrate-binding protein n=1 Tax=Crenobacter intestini TaxID=2563443 RepID=A0A4T0V6E7_9NEIS|nr:CmpA/NrtA family ABC transporter substrate-binding protein [Crenobacter intestini]TIC87007.1 ABC transporter substrate-binding protein [Crenobacter intestini]
MGMDDKAGNTGGARRDFLRGAVAVLGAVLAPTLPGVAMASALKPEKTEVKVGFIPLTDCASVIVASKMGFDKKYGITIVPSKEASWAAVRDKLVNGELDASHALYGLVYGVHLGIGGQKKDMAVLMTLNQNGQGITLSKQLKDKGVTSGAALAKLVKAEPREYTFAQTFPTGTHAMWLYYWLAAQGINPLSEVKTIVVPPPQMVANMRVDNMDGYCVGEPWNARAIADNIGFTVATTQEVWPDHPEKVLGTTGDWVRQNPNTARALVAALLEASRYIDDPKNRPAVARMIADKAFVNAPAPVIEGRFTGAYEDGLGRKWQDAKPMKFFDGGKVNFPYLSDGMWFLTQHKRWGLIKTDPDYLGVARQINQLAVYRDAAKLAGVPVPKSEMRTSRLIDGVVWDGKNPAAYAASFKIKA